MCSTVTPLEYSHMDVLEGETVSLVCNTSADSMWTYNFDDGLVDYIYWNGHVDKDRPRLSVNTTASDLHILIVSSVHLDDSGLYECYSVTGQRSVGYQLSVASV